jgi:hypothetical protein
LRLQCGMPCSKLEVSAAQHGTLSGAGYLHQSRWDDVRLNHAEQAGRMKALREAIAKGAKLNRTPGILAEPTEPGSARKAIEEAMAKLESDRANRGQAKAKAKRDGAPSS